MRREKRCWWQSGIVGLGALCAWAIPGPAIAQGVGAHGGTVTVTNAAEKRVTVKFEDVALTDAVKALMNSVHANYTIDPAFRNVRVTASLTDVPLRVALAVLIKTSGV